MTMTSTLTGADLAMAWLKRLDAKLTERQRSVQIFSDYYHGKHRLEFASEKFLRAFGGRFQTFADNWCRIVVEAPIERLRVDGFRFGETGADERVWEIWQENQLDADSVLAHREALICSVAYVSVWPTRYDDMGKPMPGSVPSISVETPDEVIVAYQPGRSRVRQAALKRWVDELSQKVFATVYLPDGLYKFQSTKPVDDGPAKIAGQISTWEAREIPGEAWPVRNPLEVVPIVPLVNNPRLGMEGESELATVVALQDAINKTVMDALISAEFAAFPQRWATGMQLEEDPETGEKQPPKWQLGEDRMILVEDEGVKFGVFEAADLERYVKFTEMLVQHVASQSRTPPHYLNPGADRLSGESIKAAETGLVSKVRQKQQSFGEGWEEAVNLALTAAGEQRDSRCETIWSNPEIRSEAEMVDATVKKVQGLAVPLQQAWEDVGYSPTTVNRFRAMRAQELLDRVLEAQRTSMQDAGRP